MNWGPGEEAKTAKPYAQVTIGRSGDGQRTLDLVFGEHPHSRQDNNSYARDPRNGELTGFSGHRWPVRLELEEFNYMKSSGLSGDDIRRACVCKLMICDVHVKTYSGRDFERVLLEIMFEIPFLMEAPFRPWMKEDVDRLVGRKVYYRDEPARCTRFDPESGVFLVPTSAPTFSVPGWARGDDGMEEDWPEEYGKGLWVGITDRAINWHRD